MKRQTDYEKAYQAYVRKYTKNVSVGMASGMKPLKALALQDSMLTKGEFEDNIRMVKAELKTQGKRASSATKLGEQLANEQTTIKTDKQVKALREAYRNAKNWGIYQGNLPTTEQLRYGEHQEFFKAIRGYTDLLGIDYNVYVSETIFGSP